jgi:hypothetical protein
MGSRTKHTLVVLSLACAGVAAAWQSALSAVGWTEEQASQIAESFFTGSSTGLPNNGSMAKEIKQRWLGRSAAERAQAIRDLALHAKRYVQTPAFEKLYIGWIKEHYSAVNHGIKIDPNAAAKEEDVNAVMSAAATEMATAMGELPAEAISLLLNTDIESLKESTEDKDKRLLARYRRVESLVKTNLGEARKQYGIAKAMQLTGQTDEAQLQATLAAGAKTGADAKKVEEQRAWDEHNLKAELRRRLTEFIALAESVDFAAATQRNAGKMRFTNSELEQKPHHWKVLYRLGKEPTLAAVGVAKQWLREL